MKRLLLSVFVVLSLSSMAQFTNDPLTIEFQSFQEEFSNGTLELPYDITIAINDTVTIDTIEYYFVNNEGLEIDENTLNTGLYTGSDGNTESLYITYSQENTPFYLQELRMYVTANGQNQLHVAYLFFSPWGTVDVYSPATLPNDLWTWITPTEFDEEPLRAEIDPDTLPTELPDTSQPMCYKFFDGLAYGILVNCDTTDTLNTPEFLTRTIKGRAIGTITVDNLQNDLGAPLVLKIAKIRVEAWSNLIRIGKGHTDGNGNFNFNFEKIIASIDNEIPVRLKVIAQDETGKVEVHYNSIAFGANAAYKMTTSSQTFRNTSSDREDMQFGRVNAGIHRNFQVFHWTKRAIDFAHAELAGWSIPWAKCKVFVPDNPAPNGTGDGCFFRHSDPINDPPQGKIRLTEFRCLNNEFTSYHEVGHFVHFAIQNRAWLNNTGGTHTLQDNNRRPAQTITEGFASFFAFMVDDKHHADDGETFNARNNDPHDLGRRIATNVVLFQDVNPYTAEWLFARALYDLWDDVGKMNSFGYSPNITEIERINDVDFQGNRQDFVNLTFKQVALPFYNNRGIFPLPNSLIGDVPRYFNELYDLTNDCELRGRIKQIAEPNFENPPFQQNQANNFFRLNSDFLARSVIVQHLDEDLRNDGNNPQPYSYSYTVPDNNGVDLIDASLTVNTGSYNNAIGSGTASYNLSDDLTLSDNTNLFFNNNIPVGWINDNSSVRPPANSHLISDICGAEIVVESGSSLIIGDALYSSSAEITADNGARIILQSGATLRINANSKFVIGRDASLRFNNGASIILDDDNAVLEIKGEVDIANNTTFTFQGDGYIKTDFPPCLNCDNIVAGVNTSISLSGNGTTDKILEVAANSNFEVAALTEDFILNNGRIELGENSILHTRSANIDFQDLEITSSDPSKKFGEIMLNGNSNHIIKNVDISSANRGINDRQIYGGGMLTLNNVNFTTCNTGLYTNGRGAFLTACDFTNNNVAWEQVSGALGFNSKIQGCTMTNNNETVIFNSAGGNLDLVQSTLDNNGEGLNFIGSGTLSGNCSSVSNNAVGIYSDNLSIIDFDGQSRMSVKNNAYNIVTVALRGLYLDDGRNDFEKSGGSNSLIFFGDIRYQSPMNSGATINVDKNHWKASGIAPIQNTDYILDAIWIDQSGNMQSVLGGVNLNDPNPTLPDPIPCSEVSNNPCLNIPCLSSNPMNNCPTCPVVNTPNYQNMSLNDAIMDVLNNLEVETPDYLEGLSHLNELLMATSSQTDAATNYVKAFAYNEMKKTFAKAIDAGLISTSKEDNSPTINSNAQLLLDVMQDRAITDMSNDVVYYNEKLYHELDEIMLYRSLSRYDLALAMIPSTLAFTRGNDLVYVEELQCKLNTENDLLDETISYETFMLQIESCSNIKHNIDDVYSYAFPEPETSGEDFDVTINPNPTSDGIITVNAENITGSSVDVFVYTSNQQLIFSSSYGVTDGAFQTQIDLSAVQSSSVYVHLVAGEQTVTRLVIIQ